jgi:DNA-binding CsgD family transcriptional regulator/tetratricopeptide (TPR) repeat protein
VEAEGLWHWHGDLGVTPRLAELVGFSLDRLAPDEREILEVVALAEPLPVRIVEAIGPPGVALRLEARGLLAPGAEAGLVRPGHPLIGEAAVAALRPLQRRHLLGLVLDAFETLGDGDAPQPSADAAFRPDHRARLALWALDADRPVAVAELRAAARMASARRAYAECERLARAALTMEPDAEMAVLVGTALHMDARFEAAEQFYARAEALVVTDDELVDLTVKRARTLRFGFGRHDEAAALLDDARGRMRDPALAWELVATEARHAILAGQGAHVPALWAEAADAPERARYVLAESAAAALGWMGRLDECAEVARWVAEAAPRQDEHRPIVQPLVQHWLVASLATAGEIETAEAMARPAYDAAVRTGQSVQQAYLSTTLAISRLLAGDALGAEQFAREATLAPSSSQSVRMVGLATLARALVAQGRATDAAAVLETFDAERDPRLRAADIFERIALALVQDAQGHRQAALDGLDRAFRDARAAATSVVALHAVFDLIRLGGQRSTIHDAVRLSRDVEGPFAELVGGYGRAMLDADANQLVALADLAATTGLHLVEVAALTSAIALDQGAGRTAAAARAEARRSAALVGCPGLVVSEPALDLGLSEREREVAVRAACGTPDKRIAADLGISVRTVNAHLRAVYAKLGVSSRLDLAAVPGLGATNDPTGASEP